LRGRLRCGTKTTARPAPSPASGGTPPRGQALLVAAGRTGRAAPGLLRATAGADTPGPQTPGGPPDAALPTPAAPGGTPRHGCGSVRGAAQTRSDRHPAWHIP